MKTKILILGASGLIGRYLYNHIEQKGISVIGTYNENKQDKLLHFNLINSSLGSVLVEDFNYAAICSAVTKIDKCKDNKEYSDSVNVGGMKRILIELSRNKIVPIFLSSAAVFEGNLGDYKEEDIRNPTTVYGKQKKEIEDFIFENIKDYLIIRPGKVFGLRKGEGVLFTDWLEKYKKGEEILCADDEKLSPIYAGDVAKGIYNLIEQDSRGVYHINPMEHYSRLEMAVKFFNYLSLDIEKIKKCSIDDFSFSEKRPRNTYLNAIKFINQTSFKFTDISNCFRLIKEECLHSKT